MTINGLIEKMKETEYERKCNKKEISGAYGVFQAWYKKIQTCEKENFLDYCYHNMNGFIYGLEAAHFINEKESKQINRELSQIFESKINEIYKV